MSSREDLPGYLRNHDTRISRLENQPRGNGLPPDPAPGKVVGYDVEGQPQWIDVFPPDPESDQVLGYTTADDPPHYAWLGPMWWMWWGTEDEYNALGSWDDRVLYVIVQNVPGAVTTVAAEDVAHTP